jgi:hypothetical protein
MAGLDVRAGSPLVSSILSFQSKRGFRCAARNLWSSPSLSSRHLLLCPTSPHVERITTRPDPNGQPVHAPQVLEFDIGTGSRSMNGPTSEGRSRTVFPLDASLSRRWLVSTSPSSNHWYPVLFPNHMPDSCAAKPAILGVMIMPPPSEDRSLNAEYVAV